MVEFADAMIDQQLDWISIGDAMAVQAAMNRVTLPKCRRGRRRERRLEG